jgi:hypothetical protein
VAKENSIDVNKIIDRLKEAEEIDSDADFARRIGMKPSTLSMSRKRNAIDLFLIFKNFEEYSKNWIVDGEGPMYRNQLKEGTIPYNYENLYSAAGTDIDSNQQFTLDIQKILTLSLEPEDIVEMIKLYTQLKGKSNDE